MNVPITISKELKKSWKKLIDKGDFYLLEKYMKSLGVTASRSHIKNVIDNEHSTTKERYDIIVAYYKIKDEQRKEQEKLAKSWDK